MYDDGLAEALHGAGPAGPYAEELQLFGQFVGSWDVVWSGVTPDGKTRAATGELHFGWVLGGRAVQDVWIVPGRRQSGGAAHGVVFHGSSMRFYDPAINAWRQTWVDPANGRLRVFTGGLVGDEIVLHSDENDPRLRWVFTRIRPDSFTWRGEISRDGGRTWLPDEEMRITRR